MDGHKKKYDYICSFRGVINELFPVLVEVVVQIRIEFMILSFSYK